MKILDIAFKDMTRSFRSVFAIGMMVVAPLLLTGLIYFAFGRAETGFDLPVTRVQVVNLDQPDSRSGFAAGQLLAEYLQGESLSELLRVTVAPDQASARAAVERQEADVALALDITDLCDFFVMSGKNHDYRAKLPKIIGLDAYGLSIEATRAIPKD